MKYDLGVLSTNPTPQTFSVVGVRAAFRVVGRCWRACVLAFAAALIVHEAAQAGIVTQYSFTGATLNRNATTVAGNVTAGPITDAPTVNNNATVTLVRTNSVGYATEPVLSAARANFNESSVRDNVYFTFTVTPDAGFDMDLSSLAFKVAQGGGTAATRDYDIRTSLDGFVSSLTGIAAIPTVRPTFTNVSVDLSAVQFQNLAAPLTFQFRFFTPGVLQNVDFDDITLNGDVTAIPEPGAPLMMFAGVACWVFPFAACWVFRRMQRSALPEHVTLSSA